MSDVSWHKVIARLLEDLEMKQRITLPRIRGLTPLLFARWLYRSWLERYRSWGPFMAISEEHLEDERIPGWEMARGGFLFLDTPSPHLESALEQAIDSGEIKLLLPAAEDADELDAPRSWRSRARRMDAYHDLATDPALARVRRSLRSHCKSASPVHLRGEHGVGKARLAMWAHAVLDDRPLSHMRGDQGRHTPGQWMLFEEVGELGDEQRGLLDETIRAQDLMLGCWPHAAHKKRRPAHPELSALVGHNATFVELLWNLVALAPRKIPILLTGEPGVGKEVLARAIHDLSHCQGEFVAVDMGAIPPSLFESELFGHKRGAFTDAKKDRQGAFLRARGGTLFLDEIGNLSLELQVKLLRVLQERRVTPVGADRAQTIDCRIVTATNANLEALANRGKFRFDLLGRLNAATLRVPPLRQRRDDIEALARSFASKHRELHEDRPWCEDEVLELLLDHTWPGNIRELSNIIDFACAVTPEGELLSPDALGPLAPSQNRATPVLSTHSGESSLERDFSFDPSTIRALCATTLELPPLRERGKTSKRHLILQGLAGRPITRPALHALESYPWWGNLRELSANLAVLASLAPGPIDLAKLNESLPHLLGAAASAPITILLSPTRDPRGEIAGLTWEVDAGAVLIGRAGQLEHISRGARAGDARSREWLDFIQERLPDGSEPHCLEIPFMRRLSRAHALLRHGREGLEIFQMPGVRLEVHARALGDRARSVASDTRSISLGQAGEVCFVHPRTEQVYLQLFVFSGELARLEFGAKALEIHEQLEQQHERTLSDTTHHEPREEEEEDPLYRWTLEEEEAEMLVDICANFSGGMFKQHVMLCLESYRDRPELARLVDYLERAPRMSQYITRLFSYEHNTLLREMLSDKAADHPDAATWLELLPVGVRRTLDMT